MKSDRDDVRIVLRAHQSRTIARCSAASVMPTKSHALATASELDEYTYLVAGCVGEFWTELCFRHLRRIFRINAAEIEMRHLGRATERDCS